MRIAAIDIGTNSLQHDCRNGGGPISRSRSSIGRRKWSVWVRADLMVEHSLLRRRTQAFQVLSKFRRLAESHKVDEVIAVATSATREAENGGEFLRAITQQTGIRPQVISGPRKRGSSFSGGTTGSACRGEMAVDIDIGGGSVEVTRGIGPAIELGRSFKLGVIRLTERFLKTDSARSARRAQVGASRQFGDRQVSDPDRARRIRARHRHVRNDSQPRAPSRRPPRAAQSARRLAQPPDFREADPPGAQRDGIARSRRTAARARSRAAARGPGRRRRDSAGRDPQAARRRGDHALRSLAAGRCSSSITSPATARRFAQADRYPDVRRRSVFELAERCNYWPDHSQQVATAGDRPLRSDAGHSRPDRSRAGTGWSTPPSSTTSACTSATKGTTSIRITS